MIFTYTGSPLFTELMSEITMSSNSHSVKQFTQFVNQTYSSQLPDLNSVLQQTLVIVSTLAKSTSQITSTCLQYNLCALSCPKWSSKLEEIVDSSHVSWINLPNINMIVTYCLYFFRVWVSWLNCRTVSWLFSATCHNCSVVQSHDCSMIQYHNLCYCLMIVKCYNVIIVQCYNLMIVQCYNFIIVLCYNVIIVLCYCLMIYLC